MENDKYYKNLIRIVDEICKLMESHKLENNVLCCVLVAIFLLLPIKIFVECIKLKYILKRKKNR